MQSPVGLLRLEGSHEIGDDLLQFGVCGIRDLSFTGDGLEDILVLGAHQCEELRLEFADLSRVQLVEVATDTGIHNGHL